MHAYKLSDRSVSVFPLFALCAALHWHIYLTYIFMAPLVVLRALLAPLVALSAPLISICSSGGSI